MKEEKIKVTVSVTKAKDENIEKLIDLPNTEEKIIDILNKICTDEEKYRWGIRESNCDIFNRNVGEITDLFEFNDLLTRLCNKASIEQIRGILEFDEKIPLSLLVDYLEKGYYEFYENEFLENIGEIVDMGYHQTDYGVIKEDVGGMLLNSISKMKL